MFFLKFNTSEDLVFENKNAGIKLAGTITLPKAQFIDLMVKRFRHHGCSVL